MPRPQRPLQIYGHPLLTGHFSVGLGYGTVREHGTGDWLLVHTVAGSGRFGSVKGTLLTKPGDVVLLSPGAYHDYGVDPVIQRWEVLWAHFQPRSDWLDLLGWPEYAPGLATLTLTVQDHRECVQLLSRMHLLATGRLNRRVQFAMNALETALLWLDERNPLAQQGVLDERIRATVDWICSHTQEHVELAHLARIAGLSVSRFAHLFRDQVGVGPQQFLEAQRLERARHLLEFTRDPVQEVALAVGFANPFHFSTRFRRLTGMSPREFRKSRGS